MKTFFFKMRRWMRLKRDSIACVLAAANCH
jgi:hypothetical protein